MVKCAKDKSILMCFCQFKKTNKKNKFLKSMKNVSTCSTLPYMFPEVSYIQSIVSQKKRISKKLSLITFLFH